MKRFGLRRGHERRLLHFVLLGILSYPPLPRYFCVAVLDASTLKKLHSLKSDCVCHSRFFLCAARNILSPVLDPPKWEQPESLLRDVNALLSAFSVLAYLRDRICCHAVVLFLRTNKHMHLVLIFLRRSSWMVASLGPKRVTQRYHLPRGNAVAMRACIH